MLTDLRLVCLHLDRFLYFLLDGIEMWRIGVRDDGETMERNRGKKRAVFLLMLEKQNFN